MTPSSKSISGTTGKQGKTTRGSFLRKRPKEPAERKFFIGAIDVETAGLGGDAIIWTLYHELLEAPLVFDDTDAMLSYIFDFKNGRHELEKTRWYSHNAEFDWNRMILQLKRQCDDRGYVLRPAERMEGKLYSCRVEERPKAGKESGDKVTEFYDSMALYGQSLDKFASSFAPDLPKLKIDIEHFDKNNSDHIAYAKRDVETLVECVKNFDRIVWEQYGVHVKGTISGTAMAAFQAQLDEGTIFKRICKEPDAFVREAYYGGMVRLNAEIGRVYNNVQVIDFNSRYPATMREGGVPVGGVRRAAKYVVGRPGIYRIKAVVPESVVFPTLPKRTKSGLCFPVGRFETYATSLEIERASEIDKAEIEILDGYYFDEVVYPFTGFVDRCENLRSLYKGTPTEQVVKLLQNSLYGKFGTGLVGRELLASSELLDRGWMPYIDHATGRVLADLYFRESDRDSGYMMPHWASWITAGARIALLNVVHDVGWPNVNYTDTDCVHIHGGIDIARFIGNRYGELKLEHEFDWVRYHAPKCYIGEHGGEFIGVAKGIPKAYRNNKEFMIGAFNGSGEKAKWESVCSTLAFLRTGRLSVMRERSLTDYSNVMSHRIIEGKYYPLMLEEF